MRLSQAGRWDPIDGLNSPPAVLVQGVFYCVYITALARTGDLWTVRPATTPVTAGRLPTLTPSTLRTRSFYTSWILGVIGEICSFMIARLPPLTSPSGRNLSVTNPGRD